MRLADGFADTTGAGDGVMEPLNGHEAGNGGYSQGASCTPPRRSPTRLATFRCADQAVKPALRAVSAPSEGWPPGEEGVLGPELPPWIRLCTASPSQHWCIMLPHYLHITWQCESANYWSPYGELGTVTQKLLAIIRV